MSVYAIVEDGGKQYRVEEGLVLDLEKKPLDVGATFEFERVLLTSDGEKVNIGRPHVTGARVVAEVTGQRRGEKVTIFMYRRRKNYHRKLGHRQSFTQVRIREIVAP